jgi:protein disulfide-isomerase A1
MASKPTENVPYFTPAQEPPAGTPYNPDEAPMLFTPLTIRGVTLNHRIAVSPMCTYSESASFFLSLVGVIPKHKQETS